MIFTLIKNVFKRLVSLARNYTILGDPTNPKCHRALNRDLILKIEPDYDRYITDFLKHNTTYDIWKMDKRLHDLLKHKKLIKFHYLNEIVNVNPFVSLSKKNADILRYNDTNPIGFLDNILSPIKISSDIEKKATDTDQIDEKTSDNANTINSSDNTKKSSVTVNQAPRPVFTVTKRANAYLDCLSKCIYKNIPSIKGDNTQRIKDFLINLEKTKLFKSSEQEVIHKNIAYVVVSIIGKIFTSSSNSNYAVVQQTLRKDLGRLFIESYVIAANLKETDENKKITGHASLKKAKEAFIKEVLINNDSASSELLTLDHKELVQLGSFFLMCIEEARLKKKTKKTESDISDVSLLENEETPTIPSIPMHNPPEPLEDNNEIIDYFNDEADKDFDIESAEEYNRNRLEVDMTTTPILKQSATGSVDSPFHECLLTRHKIDEVKSVYGKLKKVSKIVYMLSNFGRKCLEITPITGSVYPLLKKSLTYQDNETVYTKQYFKFSMYRYADDSNIRDECTDIHKEVYEALNYLQDTEYAIDKKQLWHIQDNLLEYFLIASEFKYSALKYDSCNRYTAEVFEKTEGNISAKMLLENRKLYDENGALINKIIETVCIADIYKNHSFFFNHFLDYRGRIYCHGYPLSPQADMISRSLITLLNEPNVVGSDVTASGFQIIGLLTGSVDLLELTNYIPRDKYPIEKYKDLYHKIQQEFPSFLYDYIKDSIYLKEKEYKLKSEEEKYSYFKPKTMEEVKPILDVLLCENFFDRALIKNISMCYIYGETAFSRGNKIDEKYALHTSGNKLYSLKFISASAFEKYVEKTFPELYKFKEELVAMVNLVCRNDLEDLDQKNEKKKKLSNKKTLYKDNKESLSKEISNETSKSMNLFKLCASKNHITTVLNYVKHENYRHNFYNVIRQKVETVEFSIPAIPFTVNLIRTRRSIIPNFIHMIDSVIAMKTILKCKEENIKLFTVHDSFYTAEEHVKRVKEIYYLVSRNLMLNDHPLKNLFEINENAIREELYDKKSKKLTNPRKEFKYKFDTYIKNSQTVLENSVMNKNILKRELKSYYNL